MSALLCPDLATINTQATNMRLNYYFRVLTNYVILPRDSRRSKIFHDGNAEQTLSLYYWKSATKQSAARAGFHQDGQ